MESIYESLFSSGRLFSEQLARCILPEVPEDGCLVILAGPDRHLWASDEARLEELFADQETLLSLCDRIDDGQDPIAAPLDGGCLLGTELYTERINAGYLFVAVPGYSEQAAQANMDLIELLFAQMRLVCGLVEKNNQLHQLQLNHMSKTSSVLSKHQS